MKVSKVFKGSFFHSPTYGEFEFLENALIEVDGNGIILAVIKKEDKNYNMKVDYARKNNILLNRPC